MKDLKEINVELKNCPFCGSSAIFKYERGRDDFDETYRVCCSKCWCKSNKINIFDFIWETPTTPRLGYVKNDKIFEELSLEWNKRSIV